MGAITASRARAHRGWISVNHPATAAMSPRWRETHPRSSSSAKGGSCGNVGGQWRCGWGGAAHPGHRTAQPAADALPQRATKLPSLLRLFESDWFDMPLAMIYLNRCARGPSALPPHPSPSRPHAAGSYIGDVEVRCYLTGRMRVGSPFHPPPATLHPRTPSPLHCRAAPQRCRCTSASGLLPSAWARPASLPPSSAAASSPRHTRRRSLT